MADTNDGHSRGFFHLSDELAQVRYQGLTTIGSPGRAFFHDRNGGISELIWDALAEAGWHGHTAGIEPTIAVCMRVAPPRAPSETNMPGRRLLPGGPRREGERGRITDDGVAYQRYEGPLHAWAVRGIRLVDSERQAEDFDYLEDMLYTAAIRAGWLSGTRQPFAVIPDVEILIGITRRNP